MLNVNDSIIALARKVDSPESLAELLNMIKAYNFGSNRHPVTAAQIRYWADPERSSFFATTPEGKRYRGERYASFQIPKKSGGYRQISAPAKPLKQILRLVNAWLKCLFTPSPSAMGFVDGRSVVDNARRHLGAAYVFNTDLRDFFPSVSWQMLFRRLLKAPFNFAPEFAALIAGLCTSKIFDANGAARYILPQGAPTSPTLTNAVCSKMDARLEGLARQFGVKYSRYADDITFSGEHNIFYDGSEFRHQLAQIIKECKFVMHPDKTRICLPGQRHEVTGIINSSRINVPRRYLRDLRSILYIWETYGYDIAVRNYCFERGGGDRSASLEMSLYGRLMWVRNVRGADDPIYCRLLEQYNRCLELLAPPRRLPGTKTDIFSTMSVADFEERHNVALSLRRIAATSAAPTNASDTPAPAATTAAPARRAELRGYARGPHGEFAISVSAAAARLPLSRLAISLCRSHTRGYFWLLHLPTPSPQSC